MIVAGLAVVAFVRDSGRDIGGSPNISVAVPSSSPPESVATTATTTTVPTTAVATTPVPVTTGATVATVTSTTTTSTTLVSVSGAMEIGAVEFVIRLRAESRIDDTTTAEFQDFVLATLNDDRGWNRAGVFFELDPESDLLVVVADPTEVDELCLPLITRGTVSCQNGTVVALNRDRWLTGPEPDKGWDNTVDLYRSYLVNHEVGHLLGLRHPTSRCPVAGGRAAVMEQQTGGLVGCVGNGFPLDWEIEWALRRPAKIAPLPEWDGPFPDNPGDSTTSNTGSLVG